MDLTTLLVATALLVVGLLAGYRLGRHRLGSRSSGDVDAMLTGTHSAVQRLEAQLREIDRERAGSSGALREQLAALHHTSSELSRQTASLAAALRTPQVRGRWGELQLERIVELAGMAEHCDFDTQVTVGDAASGFSRPDLVVRLAGGRVIPVDAKVPFGAWLEAIDRGLSGPDAEHLLLAHARAMRAHVDALAGKAYWRRFQPSPEFVVMFVPGEPLLDAALQRDPELIDYAFRHNVVLATPTTLITLLRTVAFSWRQERLSASAAQIHTLGRELHERIGVLGDHLQRLGGSLAKSVEHFNGTVASLESRVLVTARRFSDLQGAPELPEIEQIELAPRRPQAPELTDMDEPREPPGRQSRGPSGQQRTPNGVSRSP